MGEQPARRPELYYQGHEPGRQQAWDEARGLFKQSDALEEAFPRHPINPSQGDIERCEFYKSNPLGPNRGSVWTLTSKQVRT